MPALPRALRRRRASPRADRFTPRDGDGHEVGRLRSHRRLPRLPHGDGSLALRPAQDLDRALPALPLLLARSERSEGARDVEALRSRATGDRPRLRRLDHLRALDLTGARADGRSEEHTSELQSLAYLVCRLL